MSKADDEYAATAERLVERIMQLIPAHPQILKFKDPWRLFKIKKFKCGDIGPSLAQAAWALAEAQHRYKEQN